MLFCTNFRLEDEWERNGAFRKTVSLDHQVPFSIQEFLINTKREFRLVILELLLLYHKMEIAFISFAHSFSWRPVVHFGARVFYYSSFPTIFNIHLHIKRKAKNQFNEFCLNTHKPRSLKWRAEESKIKIVFLMGRLMSVHRIFRVCFSFDFKMDIIYSCIY